MCDTCPSHIPGPGEVAGGVLGAAVGAAISKPGRRVMFWGLAVPMLPFAVWGLFGWWTIALVALAAAASASGLAYMRVLHRGHMVLARPEPTPETRAALAARGLRPIPAPGQARPALPRAMRRQLGRGRLTATVVDVRAHKPAQALPVAAKAIEPTAVLPASSVTRVRRTAQ
jgi:hypothetical protein